MTKLISEVKVGQVFRDRDPRMTRFIRVTALEEDGRALVKPCDESGAIHDRGRPRYTRIATRRLLSYAYELVQP